MLNHRLPGVRPVRPASRPFSAPVFVFFHLLKSTEQKKKKKKTYRFHVGIDSLLKNMSISANGSYLRRKKRREESTRSFRKLPRGAFGSLGAFASAARGAEDARPGACAAAAAGAVRRANGALGSAAGALRLRPARGASQGATQGKNAWHGIFLDPDDN